MFLRARPENIRKYNDSAQKLYQEPAATEQGRCHLIASECNEILFAQVREITARFAACRPECPRVLSEIPSWIPCCRFSRLQAPPSQALPLLRPYHTSDRSKNLLAILTLKTCAEQAEEHLGHRLHLLRKLLHGFLAQAAPLDCCNPRYVPLASTFPRRPQHP